MVPRRRIGQWLRLLAGLFVVCWALGCLVSPDERLWKERKDAAPDLASDLAPDTAQPDQVQGQDLALDGSCSAAGSPTSCDPVAVTGCVAGSCYIIPTKGSSCVCPEGTAVTGEACNTTSECAPGNVCAGIAAPGICRATCDTAGPTCGTAETCTAINSFPQWGYCEP